MAGKWQLRDREAERALFSSRLFVASVVCLILFIVLLINLFNLQVIQHDYFSSRADGNRLHSQYVAPSRGLIYDSSGALLADNQPIFNLTVVREQVPDLDAAIILVGQLLLMVIML